MNLDNKLIEAEFEAKQRMPIEMKKDALKSVLQNLVMVVIVLVLLSVMCFMDENQIKENFSTELKIISTVFAVISIIFFEIAYRKEKANVCFWAIELLILGMIVMFVPYLSQYVQNIIIGIAIGFGIYYLIKLVLIVLKKQKEFSDKKSDVKEIVKDDKKSYLDDVSKKKFKKDGIKKND